MLAHFWCVPLPNLQLTTFTALEAERFLEAHGHAAEDGGPAAIEEESAADKAGAKEPALVAA